LTVPEASLALLFALVLGGAIGLERELHGRPAGLRTHILVCLSSTMLILIARELGTEELGGPGRTVFDPNRMGAGIVTGIGFLGASTVLRSGDFLRGLTTAACIWFVAGLGIVLGAGHFALGAVCTAFAMFVLTAVNRLSRGIRPVLYRRLIVITRCQGLEELMHHIQALLSTEHIKVIDIVTGHDNERDIQEIVFFTSMRNHGQSPRVTEGVAQLEGVQSARWKQVST
jgi:putative Mg2+ transporter-C (MgtC) family protein